MVGTAIVRQAANYRPDLLDCRHDPLLVLLAYGVACIACFATLDMAERQSQSEDPMARRQWRVLGACCLAAGIWALHFISTLALQAPVDIRYDVPMTGLSLLIALLTAWFAMNSLDRDEMRLGHYVQSALLTGLGIVLMHFAGMAGLKINANQFYEPVLTFTALAVTLGASLLVLSMGRFSAEAAAPCIWPASTPPAC